MAGFFEDYVSRSTWRDKVGKWAVILLVALVVLACVNWTLAKLGKPNISDFREQWQARKFFNALRAKDYNAAYRLWGCDPARPCRDYSMVKFMEDWGPVSIAADMSKMEDISTRHCETGVIRTVQFSRDDVVSLWVDRRDRFLSFAPWGESCTAPSVPVP